MRWLTAVLLGLLAALPVQAQTWYEVEVLIFSQSHPDLYSPGASEEAWPDTLRPTWPEPLIRFGPAAGPSPALRVLPNNQRRLNNDAYALRVTDGYQVLWHQAWRQPLLDQTRSPWIQIEAGADQNGQRELEGALRIYLERFLHIDTELWLSRFADPNALPALEQADQLPPFSLPDAPFVASACQFFAQSWPSNLSMEVPSLRPGQRIDDWWFPPFNCAIDSQQFAAGLPIGAAIDPYVRIDPPLIRYRVLAADGETPLDEPVEIQAQLRQPEQEANAVATEALKEAQQMARHWQIEQIIPVRQSRRMRSGELHYIDHPALGLLVLVSPVEAPILQP